jgi:hypothetical protein
MVISEGQTRVMEAIEQKTEKAITLYGNLVKAANNSYTDKQAKATSNIQLPEFLTCK